MTQLSNVLMQPSPSAIDDDCPFNALNGQLAHLIQPTKAACLQVAKDKKMEKLRLCYVHNVPNNPVFIDVDSVKQATDIKEVIANVMLDLQENNQIPDFSNVFWLEVFEDDEWLEWTNEDGESFDEVSEL